jgi:hypothetical protein
VKEIASMKSVVRKFSLMGLAAIAVAASACGRKAASQAPAAVPATIKLEVAGRSNAAPSVAAFGKTVAAVWTATANDVSDIYLSTSSDAGVTFAAPVRVNDIEGDARASGEQAARVAIGHGNIIHVAWPARRDSRSVIRYANSTDGGRTFSPAVTVAGETLSGARGWHALALGYDGAVHAVWLDGRNAGTMSHGSGHVHGGPAPAAAPMASGGPRQDIFHASWKDWGTDEKDRRARSEHLVQANVCFCCKTSVATSGENVYVAWRHIYPGSLRDIAVARSADNGATFGPPTRVSEDGWKIDACPDDGPALAADGHGGIHIVWPTLVSGETPRKGIFYSTLADDAFAPRVRLDAGDADPAHPQIAADEHLNTAAVWDERFGDARRVIFRTIVDKVPQPAQIFAGDSAAYPTVAGNEGFWIVLWTVQGPEGRSTIEGRRIVAAAH